MKSAVCVRICKAGRLDPECKKTEVGRVEAKYLGYLLGRGVVKSQLEKTEVIKLVYILLSQTGEGFPWTIWVK